MQQTGASMHPDYKQFLQHRARARSEGFKPLTMHQFLDRIFAVRVNTTVL